MSLIQKITTMFVNANGSNSRSQAVTVVNKLAAAVPAAIVRPTNTTAYAAGDAVGQADEDVGGNAGSAILEFANIGPLGGAIRLHGLDLRVDLAALPASMAGFKLHLYSEAPAAILDNAAWDLAGADRAKHLATLAITVPVDVGGTLVVARDDVNKIVQLAEGSSSLFGVLTTDGAYTPSSGESIQVRLSAQAL